MPTPAHLVPILDALGDGATVAMAETVARLIDQAKTKATDQAPQGCQDCAEGAALADRYRTERDEALVENATLRQNATSDPGSVDAAEPTAAEIRAWAAEAGIDCTPRGKVPPAVRDAYLAAHQTGD